ncbi:MAG: GFA family protein [Yoonia sp.]|nr:GFA family protein [Yoonia sp.]
MNGSCHCGAVTFTFDGRPTRLVQCNCSICRRLSPLWAHGPEGKITVYAAPDATIAYVWGDKGLAFHTCKTCGCTTHWAGLEETSPKNMAANMRMCDPKEIRDIPVRLFDGAESWTFLG